MRILNGRVRVLLLLSLLATWTAVLQAQGPAIGRPTINSVDPPDWFVQLPSPMLLVHGSGLGQAKFSIRGTAVKLERTQASPNGNWAILWLDTKAAAPQTIQITASGAQGSATHEFRLQPRMEPADAHRGFSPADVIYLIMTDRFADGNPANDDPPSDPGTFDRSKPRGWHGGDFAGIEQHLDYLQALGVTALWTTPVYDNGAMPESYHGYAATNLYAVDPHFGTLEEYRHLSAALHARGIKLIIDLVPNHIGVLHPWVTDPLGPPTPDWFHGTLASHHTVGGPSFNYDREIYSLIDPHAAPATRTPLTDSWFTDGMPDMNQENPLVSQYLIQNALWWVETAQLDAIRLDTFQWVGRPFWRAYHAALHSAYPNLTTVGEVLYRDPVVTSFFAGGRAHEGIDTGLDTPFDYPVYFAVRDVLAHDKPMTELSEILRQDSLYPHPERLVHFFGNHDQTRFFTEAHESLPRLKEALGLMATLRGAAELYSGDEIAMPGGEDPDNRHDFPGGFPGEAAPSAFTAATRTPIQQATFAWTAGLLATRKTHPALQGAPQQDLLADETAFVFLRTSNLNGCAAGQTGEAVLIAVNKMPEPRTLKLPIDGTALAGCKQFEPLAPASAGTAILGNGALELTVPADSFVLFAVH